MSDINIHKKQDIQRLDDKRVDEQRETKKVAEKRTDEVQDSEKAGKEWQRYADKERTQVPQSLEAKREEEKKVEESKAIIVAEELRRALDKQVKC